VGALLLLLLLRLLLPQDLASVGRYDEQGNALPISSTIQPGEYVKVGSGAPKLRLCRAAHMQRMQSVQLQGIHATGTASMTVWLVVQSAS
jgi:hypothetical protein